MSMEKCSPVEEEGSIHKSEDNQIQNEGEGRMGIYLLREGHDWFRWGSRVGIGLIL